MCTDTIFEHVIDIGKGNVMIVTHDKYGLSIVTAAKNNRTVDSVWITFDKDTHNIIVER